MSPSLATRIKTGVRNSSKGLCLPLCHRNMCSMRWWNTSLVSSSFCSDKLTIHTNPYFWS